MKKLKDYFLDTILDHPFSLTTITMTFFTLVLVRLSVEFWIQRFEPLSMHFFYFEFLHTSSFFFILFIICIFLAKKIALIPLKKASIIFIFGFTLIIFPPVCDWLVSIIFFDGMTFKSYYLFDSIDGLMKSYVTFFGDRPRDGITYGTRFIIFCALLLLTILTYINTKKVSRTIFMIFIAYTWFFLLSAFPSLITFIFSDTHFAASRAIVAGFIASPTKILGNQISDPISSINIKMSLIYLTANIFLALLIFYRIQKKVTTALIKNIRPIQTTYHIGLLFIGIGVAIVFGEAVILPSFFTIVALILLTCAIIFAWYATVIFNDCVDQNIDCISNPHRPLIQKVITEESYKKIGIFCTFFSIMLVAAINVHAAILLIGYHALSFLYNTPPLRLKRFPIIATLIASIASFFIVALGYITVTPHHSLDGFPPHIAFLLILAYTISLPIKDLKDIEGDKKNQIYTIPVLFGEKIGRLLIAIGIFTSFILSVFTLNNFSLFFPALLSSSLCFWILTGHNKKQFIFLPLSTISLVFLIVFIYSIILTMSFLF